MAVASEIQVWAPFADRVEVVADGSKYSLARDPENPAWLAGDVRLAHGTDYQLCVDGELLPDPLARWLPDGVNGVSRYWDPATVQWTDNSWQGRSIRDAGCIYELHIGTFTPDGTLDSAIERLGWLSDLGVTHVELMPVAAFDGDRGWGYDGVALNAVHEAYGGPDALARFVDACHARGLAVILDVVHNHLGPSGNHWEKFGPLTTDRYRTPWGGAINLDDEHSDDVRHILMDSALGWLRDFHIDGLRLDAIHELIDNRAVTYLEELAAAVRQESVELGRILETIGETDRNNSLTITPTDRGGLGLTAQWDDDVHHALHWLVTGETAGYYQDFGSAEAVEHAFERGFLHDGRYSSFRGRTHGRPIDFSSTDPWRLVVALQTHDQIGNRAQGDRLAQQVGVDAMAGAAALLLSLPYTPMLFMGQEWGASTPWQFFTSFPDPELGRAVTEGRAAEFKTHGWKGAEVPDPQDVATFMRSKLNWDEADEGDHRRLVDWYRGLLRLRRENPDLASASASPNSSTAGGLLASISNVAVVSRGAWATCVNLSGSVQTTELVGSGWSSKLAWPSTSAVAVVPGEMSVLTLQPNTSVVLRQQHD